MQRGTKTKDVRLYSNGACSVRLESNSRARLFMHYLREHMASESLELLLFLFCSRGYWSNSRATDEAITWDVERRKATRAAEEDEQLASDH